MPWSSPLSFPENSNERATPRDRIDCQATFRELGSALVHVQLVDLTAEGCRLRNCETRRGEEVWIRIGSLPAMRAFVIWARSREAGCKFYQPLRPHELRDLRRPAG